MKQLHAQIAAVSKALAELESSGNRELMQPLGTRLAELKARLHGARPIGQQVDGLRGVISRCQKRLAEASKVEAEATRELPGPTRGTRATPRVIFGVSQSTKQWRDREAMARSLGHGDMRMLQLGNILDLSPEAVAHAKAVCCGTR